jgi:hypothetical protein
VLMASLALLNRMIFFVQRYLHFVFLEVIDPQWHIMLGRIHSAASLDEVLSHHCSPPCWLSGRAPSFLPCFCSSGIRPVSATPTRLSG